MFEIMRQPFHNGCMNDGMPDNKTLERLQARVGKIHLRQRLGIERACERKVFGRGRTFFHIEHWYSLRKLIRYSLRFTLLYSHSQRNARRILVRHNHVAIPGLPASFENYTLLQITDLHLDFAEDFPHVLSEAVRPLQYDACVLTGDYRGETYGPWDAVLAGLQRVRVHLQGKVYGVLGNHDTICMVPGMEDMGIRMLLNEQVALERGGATIYLAGVDDPHYYRADNLEKAVEGIPENAVSILLAHSPEIYRHAAHADFSLLLCGHTHAGQICLPGGTPLICSANCPREYCAGAWDYHGMSGYTAAGSGACIVDVRLNCPPEVTLHHLHCS